MVDLHFKSNNPGAVRHGNFINYYQFHPPQNRIEMLPTSEDIWNSKEETFVCLDIGCNAGDLTIKLHDFLVRTTRKPCQILAIDIDPTLIQRAQEKNTKPNSITFECLDFMKSDLRTNLLSNYLEAKDVIQFDAVFCFSTTMWIHLNHGDDGLRVLLATIYRISRLAIIEPQPWKCYKAAVKRMNMSDQRFPFYNELKIREHVEEDIEQMFLEFGGVRKVGETGRTKWNRKILFLLREEG